MAQNDDHKDSNEEQDSSAEVNILVRTYTNPLLSLYQSAIQKYLLEQNVDIDDIQNHKMMQQAIEFLNDLESTNQQKKLENDKHVNLNMNTHSINTSFYLTNAQNIHETTKNPAAAAFFNAFNLSQQETNVINVELKTDNLDIAITTTNFIKYDTKDTIGWLECTKYLNEYRKGLKSDLHYVPYSDINDFQFKLPESKVTIGILGDWGGGNKLAKQTIYALLDLKPDIIIHLGDVYYSGTKEEFNKNYVNVINDARELKGHYCPVLSVPGNHDYYAGGKPFYDAVKKVNNNNEKFADPFKEYQQKSSFFGLSNSKFYLCGLDTGWDSGNAGKGVLGWRYPTLHSKEQEYHKHHLDEAIKNKKSIIMFSHHPLFSAFEKVGRKGVLNLKGTFVNDKLQNIFDDHLKHLHYWFWGHEHNFAVYGEYLKLKRGRLIGNGCIPEIKGDVHPLRRATKKIPVNIDAQVSTSKLKKKKKNITIYNTGFGFVHLNEDGSSHAKYYEINQENPTKPSLVHDDKRVPYAY